MTRVGWCPGGRPVAEMLAMYPGTRAVRIFVGAGKPLPTWDGAVLGPIPADVLIHLSFKTWDVPAVERWLMAMPAGRQLVLTYAHEPEQQDGGDPTPAVFAARWAELVTVLAGHPRRGDVLLAPVYTRYWWQANPGDMRWLLDVPGLDVVGWDVYNNGTSYRGPDDLLSIPRAIAARTGLPYLIAELGAVRVPSDLDGTGRIAWMRAMVDAARADGAWTVCWFHKDEWDLAVPSTAVEQRTWQEITRQEVSMTRAPANLLAVRRLLLDHLNIDETRTQANDLEPAEVGIVGDPAHRGGYHCGSDRVVTGDYSVVESPRDRTGLTLDAAGLDVGMFEARSGGSTHNLYSFSTWCVAQCIADTPDSRDLREIIYSPDGRTVKRWDRLGRRSSGDDSHLWHTHFSFFRDSIKAGRDQTPLFRRYLTTIGLIEPAEQLEDGMDVNLTPTAIGQVATRVWSATWGPTETAGGRLAEARDEARKARLTSEAVLAAVKGLDTRAVIARIDAVATEERQRDDADAQRDADLAELVRQAQTGERDAGAVVDEIARRLNAGTDTPS